MGLAWFDLVWLISLFEKNYEENIDEQRKVGENPSGNKPAGKDLAGKRPSGEKSSGKRPAGKRPAGTRPVGKKSSIRFFINNSIIKTL